MTLEEAIEILIERDRICDPLKNPDYEKALRLGIEALKRIREARRAEYLRVSGLLPGETGEKENNV